MSAVRLHLSAALGAIVEDEAARSCRTMGRVVDDALTAALDVEDAKAAADLRAAVNGRRLSFFVEHPFVLVFYADRFAGVAVDIFESGRTATRTTVRKNGYVAEWQEEGKGRPPIVSWCAWFVELCRRGGRELVA